ncbi:ceramide synthase 6-like [Macrobrachium nipponense]|uniref:ceramide synthase 6-like n=1 Tax=Macrobrachium nipponense TaxID=159736 RepID=UPI0030C8618C
MNCTAEEGQWWWWWQSLSARFWHPDFWLPLGLTWDDLRSTEDFQYPEFADVLVYPIALSAVYIFLRAFILEPIFIAPLAQVVGIKQRQPPPENKTLEEVFRRFRIAPSKDVLEATSSSLNMSERQVERWLRRRHASFRLSKYDKFMDCAYDLVCHSCFCLYGISIMKVKPWLWNITLCWANYPHHNIDNDIWWYYMLCLAYFWSTTFMHLPRPGRKLNDTVPMVLHHLFTILLMMFSWTCNFVRVGSLVLVVHECADIPLLAAKMCKHAGVESGTDILFLVFLALWVLTRCVIYPFWIMHSAFFEATTYMFMPSAYIFLGLLTGLLALNLLWTGLILGIIYRKVRAGRLEDLRSSGEEYSEVEIEMRNGKKIH